MYRKSIDLTWSRMEVEANAGSSARTMNRSLSFGLVEPTP